MKFAVCVAPDGEFGRPTNLVEMAKQAEGAGWDGLFVWDHLRFGPGGADEVYDPWILLAAAATVTTTIRLGPMVVPLARRRPWKVARETVTLDHLSGGRTILGAGLGYPPDGEFGDFGEPTDASVRAAKLDEALVVIQGLWTGKPFSYRGTHYQLDDVQFLPRPVQARIPIWIGGYWPNRAPFRRARRYEGFFPGRLTMERRANWTPQQFDLGACEEILQYVTTGRTHPDPPDFAVGGYTTGIDRAADRALAEQYETRGVTWWVENLHGMRGTFDSMRIRLLQGPPK